DVDLVLSGHRHYPNIYRIGNTVFLNAGTASARKTRYGDLNSYDSVRIGEGEMWVTSKRVDGAVTLQSFPRGEKRVFSDLGKRLFRLVHISNTFITDSKGFLEPHFDNAMAKIRDLGPDLIVHCGGVVREGIPHDYEKAMEKLSSVDGPMVFTPAGRDINYLGYHLFERTFGPFDQSYSDGEILLQGISSAQYDSSTGIVGPTERRELLEALGSSSERMRGVFLHHNVLPIPHSREKGLLEDSGDLLKNLVDAQVDMVLTGTSSHPHAARVNHTVVVNANSLSSVYQRSLFGNSFNLIDIYERAIAVFEVNSLWGRRRLLGLWEHSRFELPRPPE
ncbi:MAG: metallophosphoesterase, partial [Methanomassiliicoccales archaeon]